MDQKLLDYIEQARAAGQSDEKIQNTLRSSGWPEAIIVQAFSGAAPSDRPPAPPTPEAGVTKKGPNLFLTIAFVVGGLILLGGVFIFFTIQGSLGSARERGRDARRVGDLASLTAALELYYDTHDQYLPGEGYLSDGALDVLVQEGLLRAMPADPMSLTSYFYCASSDTQSYVLGAQLEQEDSYYSRRDLDGDQQCGSGTNACDDPVYCVGNTAPSPARRTPRAPSSSIPPPPAPVINTYSQFGTFVRLTPTQLSIRQTAGHSRAYTVDDGTQYFICDQEASSGEFAQSHNVVVRYTLPGDGGRRAVALYLDSDCGAETKPAMFARESYNSGFASPHFEIISGTVSSASGGPFAVTQTSGEVSSFTYGVDTVFYRCGVPREFTLVDGQKVSASFVPGVKPTVGETYIRSVDLRDDC